MQLKHSVINRRTNHFSNHVSMQHSYHRRRTSPSNIVDCCIHQNHASNDIVFIVTTSANLQLRGIFSLVLLFSRDYLLIHSHSTDSFETNQSTK